MRGIGSGRRLGQAVLLLGLGAACSSTQYEAVRPLTTRWSQAFVAMGTLWTVEASFPGLAREASFPELDGQATASELDRQVARLLVDYEQTFSDWSEDSELRRLEVRGLGEWQEASDLFSEGLRLSDEAHALSRGAFDPTVGAVIWKLRASPVGWNLLWKGERFRFDPNPERLSFGGNIKGMAVGHLASLLSRAGAHEFRISGGGSNLAVQKSPETGVTFVSRSRVLDQTQKSAHVLDPLQPSRALPASAGTTVICQGFQDLRRGGALSDSLSTALLIRSDFELPAGCRQVLDSP